MRKDNSIKDKYLNVQILVDAMKGPADGKIVLQFDNNFLTRDNVNKSITFKTLLAIICTFNDIKHNYAVISLFEPYNLVKIVHTLPTRDLKKEQKSISIRAEDHK